ncbi:acyl-CoA thioesterase [Vaginisenegalia massiliensis]|uniref:acyl-CoA thioesterase n=1 Tax=Vaginisenegalia massiliensis TaxID=2058294 RepID=UPI000F52EB41|nr:acyl-CoA thioesterase [Vaginisenegalia massiliensis]
MDQSAILKQSKSCSQSRVIQTHRILPAMCNMHNTLYGGRLMEMIDNCASISVSRHARCLTVTASMDTLNFIEPLPLADSVCIETMVTGTGKTSMEVFVKVVGEELNTGRRYLAATAFLTFVTVPNDAGQKVYVPSVFPETAEEKYVCAGYAKRRQTRLSAYAEDQAFNQQISIDIPWA